MKFEFEVGLALVLALGLGLTLGLQVGYSHMQPIKAILSGRSSLSISQSIKYL